MTTDFPMQNQLKKTDGWPRWLSRRVRRFSGIAIFDQETDDTLSVGCQTAEEQAEIRYGAHWRDEYTAKRTAERRERWPILHDLLPPNSYSAT